MILFKIIKIYLPIIIFFMALNYGVNFFEFNATKSLPRGFYLKVKKTLNKNSIVVFCPPYNDFLKFAKKKGYWQNLNKSCGYTPKYMKKIIGVPGDNITITLQGVFANNIKIKNSEPVLKILSDKIFKNYEKEIQLKNDEYFLMSDSNQHSFDSRYFGSIKKNQIKNEVKPILVWE